MTKSVLLALGLLWLIGNALRLPILAVPPVIPNLRDELGLSGTEIGILTGLPIVLFAVAALPGSLLIARFGAVPTMVAGLIITAVASGLRGLASGTTLLFAMSILMGLGVAVTQPAMPALVRRWTPTRIGLSTAVYTNGLLVGEILPVMLFPLIFPLLNESWRASFVLWAVPIAAIALIAILVVPRDTAPKPATLPRWWPDWHDPEIWRLGFIFASANASYFAANAFLPGHLSEAGRPDLISPALIAVNLGQLPASFLLIGFAQQLERRRWPFVASGFLTLACIGWIVLSANYGTVIAAFVLGFSAGGAFALGLTLPPLLSAPGDVARMAAAMFTVSYTIAVIVSVLSGAAWDIGGAAVWSWLPIAISVIPTIILGRSIRFAR